MDDDECRLCGVAAAGGAAGGWIAELAESICVLGENQGCLGWCVVVLKEHVEHVAELSRSRQAALWEDVAAVAAAQRRLFGPVRINYECLGNVVPHIHWHLIPRHADDPDPKSPVWGWSADRLRGTLDVSARAELAGRIGLFLREHAQEG